MFKQRTLLSLCLLIGLITITSSKTTITKLNRLQRGPFGPRHDWIEALIYDLEFTRFPLGISLHLPGAIEKRGMPFVQYFENNMKIFSKVIVEGSKFPHLSTKTIPIGFNEPCESKNHLNIDPLQVMNRNNDDAIFFDALKDWQNLVLNDNNIRICNVHLGLVCDPASNKCTCRPETEWLINKDQDVSPGGKCYLFPEANCTFRNTDEHNDFLIDEVRNIFDENLVNWFIRMVIHPMTHPICGERVGTKCDTFDTAPAKCWCLDTTTRQNCKGKTTWTEAEPVEQKLEKLFLDPGASCSELNPDLIRLLDTLNDASVNITNIYRELVKNKEGVCRFRDNEYCINKQCSKHGNFRKCLPREALDHNYNCRLKNAERCLKGGSEKCIRRTKCIQLTNSKTDETGYACQCQPFRFQNLFGDACERDDKSFFLQLFKPIVSGIDGADFRNEENTLHADLSLFENLLTLDFGKECVPQKHVDISMGIVNYFGNMEQLKESEYKPLLDKVKDLYKAVAPVLQDPFCDHRQFLTCDPLNSKCGWMHLDLKAVGKTRDMRFVRDHVCNEPVDIPKIYYNESQRHKVYQFQCIDSAFCVLDYSLPMEETIDYKGNKTHKKHCRCRRGFTGQDCEIQGKPEVYNEIETKKLAELIEFRMNRSVGVFQERCYLDIEKNFPHEIIMNMNTTDLYELIFSLEPHLKSIDPLKPLDEGLTFCDVRLLLRCRERAWNFTTPEEKLIGCDCMDGYEWVNWSWDKRPRGCYIKDGKVCDASEVTGPKCASNHCEMHPTSNEYRCQEDNSFSYVSKKSGGNRRKMQLLIVTTITLVSVTYARFYL